METMMMETVPQAPTVSPGPTVPVLDVAGMSTAAQAAAHAVAGVARLMLRQDVSACAQVGTWVDAHPDERTFYVGADPRTVYVSTNGAAACRGLPGAWSVSIAPDDAVSVRPFGAYAPATFVGAEAVAL